MSYRHKNNSLDIAILGVSAALIVVLQALAEGLRLFGLPLSLALGLIPVLVVGQLRGWKAGAILGTVFGLTSFVIAIIQMSGIEGAGVIAFNPLVTVLPRTLVGLVVGVLSGAIAKAKKRKQGAVAPADDTIYIDTPATPYTAAEITVVLEGDAIGEEDAASAEIAVTPTAEDDTAVEDATTAEQSAPHSDPKGKKLARFSRDYLLSALVTLAGVLTNTIGFLGMFYAFGHGLNLGFGVIDFALILTMVVAINTVIESVSYVVIVPAIVQALSKAKIFAD